MRSSSIALFALAAFVPVLAAPIATSESAVENTKKAAQSQVPESMVNDPEALTAVTNFIEELAIADKSDSNAVQVLKTEFDSSPKEIQAYIAAVTNSAEEIRQNRLDFSRLTEEEKQDIVDGVMTSLTAQQEIFFVMNLKGSVDAEQVTEFITQTGALSSEIQTLFDALSLDQKIYLIDYALALEIPSSQRALVVEVNDQDSPILLPSIHEGAKQMKSSEMPQKISGTASAAIKSSSTVFPTIQRTPNRASTTVPFTSTTTEVLIETPNATSTTVKPATVATTTTIIVTASASPSTVTTSDANKDIAATNAYLASLDTLEEAESLVRLLEENNISHDNIERIHKLIPYYNQATTGSLVDLD